MLHMNWNVTARVANAVCLRNHVTTQFERRGESLTVPEFDDSLLAAVAVGVWTNGGRTWDLMTEGFMTEDFRF